MLANALREGLGTYARSDSKRVPSGRLWPNGEFSLGYTKVGEEIDPSNEWMWCNAAPTVPEHELDARLEAMHELLEAVQDFYRLHAELAASGLSLSNVFNSHKHLPPTKKGLKGLTGKGTKMLRSACYLLEQKLGRDDCVMITLTVPTLGRAARVRLAQRWGVLTNRLVQYLSRELVRSGRSPAIAGCVEIQTGRLEKYRQAYLHLHLVCPAHSNTGGRWAIEADALRTWWNDAIERIVECKLPNMPRIETAIVEKSVEGYLGKYLSKGTGEELDSFIGDLGESAVPGQWWFMSSTMRNAINAATKSGKNVGVILDCFVNHVLESGTGEGLQYIRHIDCDMGGKLVTVGYVGRLDHDAAKEVREMMSELDVGAVLNFA